MMEILWLPSQWQGTCVPSKQTNPKQAKPRAPEINNRTGTKTKTETKSRNENKNTFEIYITTSRVVSVSNTRSTLYFYPLPGGDDPSWPIFYHQLPGGTKWVPRQLACRIGWRTCVSWVTKMEQNWSIANRKMNWIFNGRVKDTPPWNYQQTHLKMDGKGIRSRFLLGLMAYFQGRKC